MLIYEENSLSLVELRQRVNNILNIGKIISEGLAIVCLTIVIEGSHYEPETH